MQTIPRELVGASIFSLKCCAEMFFSFVKPNSSISRQGEDKQPSSPPQQQIPLTHQNSQPLVVHVAGNLNITSPQ